MKHPVHAYQAILLRELERIEAARTSLAGFVRYQLGHEPAKHHEVICDAVDGLLNNEFDDLLILTPPNSAKSTYTSVAIPPYMLGRYPKKQIIAISGTADLAQGWGRRARNNIGNPTIRTLFPSLALSSDSKAADAFTTTTGGGYRSFGVNSQVLGERAQILLIDDPLTSAANSPATLRQLHNYYESEALTRLDPDPSKGKVILVCQRLDRNDLAGYLIDRNRMKVTRRLKVVTLKMVCEEGDEPDGTARQPGERLWPERFSELWVEDMKRDPFRFRTLYQQEPPSDSGQFFRPDWIAYIDAVPGDVNNYMASDLALSVGTGDYSVHIIAGIDHAGRVYIRHAWRGQVSVGDTADKHLELCQAWDPFECLIDDDNASRVYVVALADRARSQKIRVNWKPLPLQGKDKETRAAALQSLMQSGRVFFLRAPWNSWLIPQLLDFPTSQAAGADDAVDALSLIGRRMLQMARPAQPVTDKPPANPNGTFFDQTLNDLFANNERENGGWRTRL